MSGRGSTRTGRPTLAPTGHYTPRPVAAGLVIEFHGEDDRSFTFDVGALPLPGWHQSLAASWAARTGPAGSLRTRASAQTAWGMLTRMIRFYGQQLRPPQHPSELRVEHVDAYRRFRADAVGERAARLELRSAARTFETQPLAGLVPAEVRDRMRPHQTNRNSPVSGYSDGELSRLVAAARTDVAALRDRLTVPAERTASEQQRIEVARSTGHVPLRGVPATHAAAARRRVAEQLFVTRNDLTPMLVLLVATTGWNVEVVKELRAEHRVIEDLAVEVEVIKRRRGPGRWHRTVTWEIGPPGNELITPGGVYLLLHELMSAGRQLLDAPAFWAVYHHTGRRSGADGCRDPFAAALDASLRHQNWVRARGIVADEPDENGDPVLLRLNFNRLKTSVDVRRTRQMGGHLPTAARSNTTAVLFRNYLSGDHATIDWAHRLIADTVAEVEQAAWAAHRRALATQGRTALEIRPAAGTEHDRGEGTETAWARCADHDHHPLTGRRCAASFLDCFHCGNCMITGDHLPRLLSLLDALEARRTQLGESAWWTRYGPAWAAIRYEVLPKFSEAEVSSAEQVKPDDSLLDLVEPSWEQP
ncbi:MAG: hypothetical protein J0I33_01090 [Microbacterium ginsengisoli]|uniref:hypothetical protein n=2 Tax=Microbacteriaceae TaxID=85023 RepID=UPI000AC8B17F|nr:MULTISPECIES: hypothetical protein [Microbacterium]MBN9197227.1 hypothetical protein [Microbacterium ginsengisoli]MBN9208677.1 hypothetical protein [Microbacterium ginsengisoli]